MFIREKKISCGRYTEVDIIPRTEEAELATKGKRGKKERVTPPKQAALNDKNSKRYLIQLGNGNFGKGDLHTSCTYSNENLPQTVEEAENVVTNYLRRIAYRRKKLGLEPLKYILVTEYSYNKDGDWLKRVHHHIIMNGGIERDEVEAMWTSQRINWKKYHEDPTYTVDQLGWVNTDRLQPDKNGIEALCKYIVKDPQGKKRWSSSRNLDRPETQKSDNTPEEKQKNEHWRYSRRLAGVYEKCNDSKYSKKRVRELATMPDAGLEEFKKIYSDYEVVEATPIYYEETGWHIYLKMWKKDRKRGRSCEKKKKNLAANKTSQEGAKKTARDHTVANRGSSRSVRVNSSAGVQRKRSGTDTGNDNVPIR